MTKRYLRMYELHEMLLKTEIIPRAEAEGLTGLSGKSLWCTYYLETQDCFLIKLGRDGKRTRSDATDFVSYARLPDDKEAQADYREDYDALAEVMTADLDRQLRQMIRKSLMH